MPSITVLNGPNLNLLGTRDPAHYGTASLADIEARCRSLAGSLDIELEFRQSNHEGELIDWLQQLGAHVAAGHSLGAVFNPGAYTHTSIGLRDAISGAKVPVIEVHISNIHNRESFRRHSYISGVARGTIVGLGSAGYGLGIRALVELDGASSSHPPTTASRTGKDGTARL